MTSAELKEIVEQRPNDPTVLGRIASTLKGEGSVEQHHADGLTFAVQWQELGGYWRCTIAPDVAGGGSADGTRKLARIDLHENGTVRVEANQPLSVTVSQEDDLLCLTRYR